MGLFLVTAYFRWGPGLESLAGHVIYTATGTLPVVGRRALSTALMASLSLQLVADVVYGIQILGDHYVGGFMTDGFLMLAYILSGVAALHPSLAVVLVGVGIQPALGREVHVSVICVLATPMVLRCFLESGRGSMVGKRVEVEAQTADGARFPAELAVTASTTRSSSPLISATSPSESASSERSSTRHFTTRLPAWPTARYCSTG